MKTFTPRAALPETRRMTRSGERCADATVISHGIPNSSSTSTAACMTGASESEPIRIKTEIASYRDKAFLADITTILHAVERNSRNAVIRRAIAVSNVGRRCRPR